MDQRTSLTKLASNEAKLQNIRENNLKLASCYTNRTTLSGDLNECAKIANQLTAHSAKKYQIQHDLSKKCKSIPHSAASNPSLITHFTFETGDEDVKCNFSGHFGEGPARELVVFEKHKRHHKVTVTQDGKLRCENCNYCLSFGLPCRHVIACNRQNMHISDFHISDFHIRNAKSYNCGSMNGSITKSFADYLLPSFRCKYHPSEIIVSEDSDAIIDANDGLNLFSQELEIELEYSKPKADSNDLFKKCKAAHDHAWAAAGKPLLASEEGAT